MSYGSASTPQGDGTNRPAVDTVAGVMYPAVKLIDGTAGSTTPIGLGQKTKAASIPVVLASDQGSISIGGTIGGSVDANIKDGFGNPIGSDGAGGLYINAADGIEIKVRDGSGNFITSTGGALDVNVKSATGWTPSIWLNQTTTVRTVKGSAGALGGWYIFNPNTSVAYVQIFDIAAAVTLGTSVPVLSLGIPGGGAANAEFADGITFSNAIKLACTTVANGSVAPATGLDVNVMYR